MESALPHEYIFYNLQRQNFTSSYTAVPGLSRNQAYMNLFLQPPESLLVKFGSLISGTFQAVLNLESKNQNLRQTRDMLLPKLISGELDVEELDIAVA